jgi:solute carrier family 12 sodium/potassium/chloride transporter 2
MKSTQKRTYGTFVGVFTPSLLTILGVIMYLRQGWVVGNAGVGGALLIVGIATSITFFTGLAMSSITTNIRIGAGGAFSIISQSLGLEMGGSIGIPFYFSQALAVAMYIFGFREGIQWIYPQANAFIVDLTAFAAIFLLAYVSTSVAFKIQFVIIAIIVGSLISIYAALFVHPLHWNFEWFGSFRGSPENNFRGTNFWNVFAVFFPAVTGVMAGANMSGELTNPRKSIPVGTMAAIVSSTVIYISLVFVAALLASPNELISNYTVLIDLSVWKPIVLAGLLGATFSSALSSIIGAPRVLLAMGEKKILPAGEFLSTTTKRGEPRNAMWITGGIAFAGLLLRNLNSVAPMITMFFMITYAMINVVVLVEQSLGLPSFRPTFHVPIIVPMLGAVGSLFVMFIINPTISLLSTIIIIAFYGMLVKKQLKSVAGDSRSGLFTALAEWATKKSNELSPNKEQRAWQPDLLIPIEAPREIRGAYRLIYSITYPKGSIKILGLTTGGETERLKAYIPGIVKNFSKENIFTSSSLIEGKSFGNAVSISMQALSAAFFKPNTVFMSLAENQIRDEDVLMIIDHAKVHNWGLILYVPFEKVGLGLEKTVNLWLRDLPIDWDERMDLGNNDLAMLTAFHLKRNWNAKLNIILRIKDKSSEQDEQLRLALLSELTRVPRDAELKVQIGTDINALEKSPQSDLHIFGLDSEMTINTIRQISGILRTSCVFTLDSGNENALV